MLGFKAFDAAQSTLVGIELMHMLRKGQLASEVEWDLSAAEQCSALAASSLSSHASRTPKRRHANIRDSIPYAPSAARRAAASCKSAASKPSVNHV